ncbi:hypothetical protein COM94_16950 [Bacillus thuringiensis]|uniref:hypothetical protein n=1 Tax=Bacillus thuringiensis TaxID=1428 RepID=UPI000BECC760|nr:hypothetical protein [Bacillus thuringiensis]PEB86075.1 hypothetical protein COM94_16950 [Bacillus thuringiensis]
MADAPKLLSTDSLRVGYPKINLAIDNANSALKQSDNTEINLMAVKRNMIQGMLGKNLFDKTNIIKSKYIIYSSGSLGSSPDGSHNASDFINISPNTNYKISGTYEQGAFYDDTKKYISGFTNASTVTVSPANARYVRLTVKNDQLNQVQLEQGTSVTSYEPYNVKLGIDDIKGSIPESKLVLDPTIIRGKKSKNLFNKDSVTAGYVVVYNSGVLYPMAGYNASDYIEIASNTSYRLSGTNEQLAFYDESKKYISGLATGNSLNVSPSNARYIRLTVRNEQLGQAQLEKGTVVTSYEPFSIKISADQVAFPVPGANSVTLTVKPDGTGDFLSPKLANDSITDSSANKWYDIIIYPGIYTEINWNLKPYVRLIGQGEGCWLKGELPPSATDAEITPQSTINIKYDFEIKNLKITAKNMRYAVHDESSGAVKDVTHKMKSCEIEHFGNKEAEEWRRSQGKLTGPDSVATLWSSTTPYGYGSSSGMVTTHEDCTFKSIVRAWYVHNREKFEKPNVNILRNCKLISTHPDNPISITIENLGSGTNDELILEGCELNGYILVNDNPWIPYELDYQYANHNDMKIRGYANTPVPYTNNTRGLALKITSNEKVVTSKVVISGSAVPILFGTTYYFEGKGGLQGYVYGRYDVSDITVGLNNDRRVSGMQRRLGDRTASPVSLVVTFEDKQPITVTFNEDYSSKDNAYILQKINDAFGINGTATLFNPAKLDRPQFTDERATYRNSSSIGIPRGSAVRRGNTLTSCELMGSTDDVDDFLGFAEEDINPNEVGTIKIKGMQTSDDVLKDGNVNFGRGNYIGISSNKPGYIVNTDKTKAIAKGVSSSFFRFKC